MMEWLALNFVPLMQVIMIDLVLAGDNAIIVGLAASRVAPEMRKKVIFWGIAGAVILRIVFAGATTQLLQMVGLMLAGGILLLWVCWKMYRELARPVHAHSLGAAAVTADGGHAGTASQMSFWAALWQIIVADVSMSLDNVLAVAGAAKGNTVILVIGLAVAVVMMAAAATYIAGMLGKYPWISWVGLIVIVYVAGDMIWDGAQDVSCWYLKGASCQESLAKMVPQVWARLM